MILHRPWWYIMLFFLTAKVVIFIIRRGPNVPVSFGFFRKKNPNMLTFCKVSILCLRHTQACNFHTGHPIIIRTSKTSIFVAVIHAPIETPREREREYSIYNFIALFVQRGPQGKEVFADPIAKIFWTKFCTHNLAHTHELSTFHNMETSHTSLEWQLLH